MSPLADHVVAITGAGSGIGEATARRLARAGAAVVLGGRRTDRLDDVATDIRADSGRAVVASVDVTSRSEMHDFVATAVAQFGRLDVLVANAGVGPISRIDARQVDDWDAMIDINLRGVLHGIDAALPVFTEQGRGHLVTIVSTAGIKITPTMGVYAGTKNAVRTILEAFRQESTDGVMKTTAISPGFVRTEFASSISDDAMRDEITRGMATLGLDPDAVARAVEFAVDQPWDVEIGDLTIRPVTQG
ncbi:SDR family oxidoreductase [Williamsia deligens]|uniref:SDR family oxidoreductase n=1 Tax=Williamsia deligens TaxID=321325 RepID=A0ABW3G907_9NOCA|nr:SDR family oxidoreductase [Williamsia deligens]MCP2193872.1 NADP-dependent 3-hydroxy acid dehydrogenase YdfG [Williamsia deligens]